MIEKAKALPMAVLLLCDMDHLNAEKS